MVKAIERAEEINRRIGKVPEIPYGSHISPMSTTIETSMEISCNPYIKALEEFYNTVNPLDNNVYGEILSIPESIILNDIAEEVNKNLTFTSNILGGFQFNTICESVQNVVSHYPSVLNTYNMPAALEWVNQLSFSPLIDALRRYGEEYEINHKLYYNIITKEMYRSKWFPHVISQDNIILLDKINDIISHTRESKNRTKQIDRAIFAYYSKSKINKIIQQWKDCHIPKHIYKMLSDAVRAYLRGEYALTIFICTLWETLIYNKVHDFGRKSSKKTKQHITMLIKYNDLNESFLKYFNTYVFYQCNEMSEVKPDVPGRHGIAHGWHNEYPSKKEALNAIMITDFILKLDSLAQEEIQFREAI